MSPILNDALSDAGSPGQLTRPLWYYTTHGATCAPWHSIDRSALPHRRQTSYNEFTH